ncbi:MAG: bifunctional oligoribonuclease/PAP phosphatase NrnA [Candidatus Symbiothrix sp.]|jgi:phosphoesterase RecJ-like protein|nr:bifunctional oligoribonuclease/PAP phosphatase NrnA [Candidatus Symbiothrix sp.]
MLNKIIKEADIQKAKKIIDKFDRFVIVTHISPDGDALGSSLGLYHFLTGLGKRVNIVVPNDFPDFLKWMPGRKEIIIAKWKETLAADIIRNAEVLFCLDFNTINRIEQLGAPVMQSRATKIMIDHHPYPDDFCSLTISHPEISSTSELIFRFICRMGLFEYLDRNCAECIYTGMMTDTGAFTYNSNAPAIYYIISELLLKGINKDAIYSKVYNSCTETRIRLQAYVIYEKMKIFPNGKIALTTLSLSEQKQFLCRKGDTEGFVNIPLSIESIVLSVFIREDENMIRISFRSKGSFPTNELAAAVFGGGGHLNASGGEYYGTLEEAAALLEEALPRYEPLLFHEL